ncbi:substrate-binding periplasmic protein [Curvivirga sp.]|uniref:substrate-binding periplasmic protein n=1 Tax=Curvivirga sp. TaxID=2856848 RepID=UPI003B5A5B3A
MVFPASGSEIIRITNGEWKPYLSKELPNYGPYSEITKRAFEKVNIEVEFGFFPWNRAKRLAEEGRWDASIIWVSTPERRQSFLLTNPVVTHQEVIYYHKDRPLKVETLRDFSGLTMGRLQSSALGGQFNTLINSGSISVSVAPTNESLFKMLYTGRIDFVPELMRTGYAAINTLPPEFDSHKLTHLEDFQFGWVFHMLVSRNIEKGPYYVKKFNKGLKMLKETGEMEEILAVLGENNNS